jgi:hypothetical protein
MFRSESDETTVRVTAAMFEQGFGAYYQDNASLIHVLMDTVEDFKKKHARTVWASDDDYVDAIEQHCAAAMESLEDRL